MEVICNSGPLIALGKLNLLYLLKRLYGYVAISGEVYKESVILGKEKGHQDALNIELFLSQNKWRPLELDWKEINEELKVLRLDNGEIESIHLALKGDDSLLLVDDERAREEARARGIRVKGTVGILVNAYRKELVTIEELKFFLKEISSRRDIWISEELCELVLKELKRGNLCQRN